TVVSSEQPGWEHSEYVADGDPSDLNRIMVCSMRFSQTRNQLVSSLYTTFDGGKNWEIGNTDDSSRFGGGVGDPACAYGVNHEAFFVVLAGSDAHPTDSKYR